MLLQVVGAIAGWIGLVALIIFLARGRSRFWDRQHLAADRQAHRQAEQRLQQALQTVPGAQLIVVQRVISSSRRGTRAVVLWTSTGTEYELWSARAAMEAGDRLAVVGVDPSTGQLDVKNVLARVSAFVAARIEQLKRKVS
ncbi:MAG TPA: hypothetical protein VIY28_20090 [Pseudonocardiaceae bacterium]